MMTFSRPACLLAAMTLVLFAGCINDSPERQNAFKTLARWEDQRSAPEDSLLSMIKNDDAHVRLQALRSAGLIGQRSVVPAMITALGDPSETVGRQAAFSLGLTGDSAAVPTLEALLVNANSRLHLAAVQALAHLANKGRGLLMATSSDNPEVVFAAWDGLRNVADKADSSDLADKIIEGLNDPRSEVLWRVLRCAERLPRVDLIPHIVPHVRSNIAQVRVHAFRALAQNDHPLALKAVLLGSLQPTPSQDRHQRTAVANCRALGQLGSHAFNPESVLNAEDRHLFAEVLIEAAGQNNPHLAATALGAMEQLGNQFDLPAEAAEQESLLPVWRIRMSRAAHSHLRHQNPGVRAAAIRSWAALRGSGSAEELRNLLKSTPASTDLEAILHALGRQAESPLQTLSSFANGRTETVPVRVAALEALHSLAGRSSSAGDRSVILNKLTQAAADSDFVIAATAIGYLDDFPERTSLIALAEAWDMEFEEGEAEVKRAIIGVINGYGPEILELKREDEPGSFPDRLISMVASILRNAFDSPD